MINGDPFKLAFGERKLLIFNPCPEILPINHFLTMTLHKKELSALENHLTSSIPQCAVQAKLAFSPYASCVHVRGGIDSFCFFPRLSALCMVLLRHYKILLGVRSGRICSD